MRINILTVTIIFVLITFSNILSANNNQELNQTNVTYSTLDTSKLEKMKIGAFLQNLEETNYHILIKKLGRLNRKRF